MLVLSVPFLLLANPSPGDDASAPAHISAGSEGNRTIVFHMHWDGVQSNDREDWMNTSGPYNPSTYDYDGDGAANWGVTLEKTPATESFINFTISPAVQAPLTIIGNVTVDFWASSTTDAVTMGLTAVLYDSSDLVPGGDIEINSTYVSMLMPSLYTLHNISIGVDNYILPANHTLVLSIIRENSGPNAKLRIFYDQTIYDSTLRVPVASHFNITSYGSYGTDSALRTEFGSQETINAFVNVTDILGAYDIKNATLLVKNATTNSTVVSKVMSLSSSGPSSAPVWKLFDDSFGPLPAGNFTVNISAADNSGNILSEQWMIRIIQIDHFNVNSPATLIEAGEEFSVTVEAMDSGGARMKNWSGILLIEAIDNLTGLPLSGLSNTTVLLASVNQGIITFFENFTIAPKNITIRVTNASTTGESQIIIVLPAAIQNLAVDPDEATIPAGSTISLTANATDRFGNLNDSWQPYWYLDNPANGTLTQNGPSVQITAIMAGLMHLTCQDNSTGLNVTVSINVTSSGLASIVVTPASNKIWEGNSTSITAIGYDGFSNPIGITGAIWSSTGFSMATLIGAGHSGLLFAGMTPEAGTVRVTYGAVSGIANITIICPPQGPSFGTFPDQYSPEDTPWVADLSEIWTDSDDGSEELTWFVTGVNDSLLIISHDMVSASKINFLPQPNANGEDNVTFWARDPSGYTNFKQIKITVYPVNDAPSFVNDPPEELYVKFNLPYSFNYSYYVQDVDNPMSQLVLTADPAADISSSGLVLTYDFPDEKGGAPYFRIITIAISDGSLNDLMGIKVWATSDTPPDLVKPLPDVTINEGDVDVLMFDLDDYFVDIDAGDVLFYSEGFENVVVFINSTTHAVYVSATSEWSGKTNAVFIAHDPTGAIRIDTITITVIAVNDPPAISPIPKVFVHYSADYLLDLRLYVNDPDNDISELTIYTDDAINASYSSVPYSLLKLNYPANPGGGAYAGPYNVVVQLHVADPGGLFDDISFTVEVSDNYPPVFARSPPDIISFMEDTYLDEPYSLDLGTLFSDPDAGDVITFTISGNKNVSVTVEPDGWLNLSASLNWFGTENITFNATDPHGAWLSFKVRVDVIPVNDPPVLSQIPDISHYGGRQWSMDISEYIEDADDPNLLLIEIKINQPAFVRAVGTTLYFEFPDNVDSAMVIVYVTDGQSNSNVITFNVSIMTDISEVIPWPIIAILLAAGIICYLLALRVLPHKMQELFLIHNDGRLVYHAGEEGGKDTDQDVVSAMFTAVQDFIKDSFREEGESLKKLEMGDRKIVIEKGGWIYAALIYTGWPPKSVFKNLMHLVKDIEGAYGAGIEHWDGTLKSLPGIESISKEMLAKKYHAGDVEKLRKEYVNGASLEDLKAEKPEGL